MAIACTPSALMAGAACLNCGLTHKQLLAALLYVTCTANKMNCSAPALSAASECLRCSMTEKQLLAALVYVTCTQGGGGSSSPSACLVAQSGGPTAPCAVAFGLAYDNNKNSPTAGQFWYWSIADNAWIKFSV